jgi:potassium/sodium efflux P-type ATPase
MNGPEKKNTHDSLWHTSSAEEVISRLQTDTLRGLDDKTVARRIQEYGPNALPRPNQSSWFKVIWHQFKSPLIFLLLIAAAIAFWLGEIKDSLVILSVITINAFIGTFQEGKAERSIEALRRLAAIRTRVMRGGNEISVEAEELVPGDIIAIAAGDAVPADARLVEASALEASEAALTGESVPVRKNLMPSPANSALGDRRNMLYAGTHVTAGRGKAIVVATGLSAEIGQLAKQTTEAVVPQSPLERRIQQFSRYVIVAAICLFITIVVIGVMRDLPLTQVLMVAISQMVSMVPEGLPIAMTVAMAVGVQRMARRGVIIRRLAAVETLGATTVICSDKTGTLTRNEMTVTKVYLPSGQIFEVDGVGYGPEGRLRQNDRVISAAEFPHLIELLKAAALCNDASLLPPDAEDPRWRPLGDPTEAALLTFARKGGLDLELLGAECPRQSEIPFDPAVKLMATAHRSNERSFIFIKGAPEVVVRACTAYRDGEVSVSLPEEVGARALAEAERMASQALRILAFAVIENSTIEPNAGIDSLGKRAIFLGLIAQMDPPREEVKEAVDKCLVAGIRPVMITGDHKSTGLAIGRSLGIFRPGDHAFDGLELAALTDEQLLDETAKTSVFARVHPSQKQRIVAALQRRGGVVAMTGDGVNDAPALASADVGVAMGITGTEVAKAASKIVITDDNFSTIVAGVEEGRLVHRNLKKVVLYLVATSAAEVLILLLALIAGYPPPLAAVQILWINLVTEGSVTVNLIMEPLEGDEMRQPPTRPDDPLLTREILGRMALMTPMIATVTLGWFMVRIGQGLAFAQVQTETFTLLAVCQWFNVLNCRSSSQSALTLDIFRNKWLIGGLAISNLLQLAVVYWPPLNTLFHTVPISAQQFFTIGAVGSLVLWIEEFRKFFVRRRLSGPRASASAAS